MKVWWSNNPDVVLALVEHHLEDFETYFAQGHLTCARLSAIDVEEILDKASHSILLAMARKFRTELSRTRRWL